MKKVEPKRKKDMPPPSKNIVSKNEKSSGSSKSKNVEKKVITKPLNYMETPIFKLLKSFRLQQYAKRFCDLGYSHDLNKLSHFSSRQIENFIKKIHIIPSHKSKLLSVFDILKEFYPKPDEQNPDQFTIEHSSYIKIGVPLDPHKELIKNTNIKNPIKTQEAKGELNKKPSENPLGGKNIADCVNLIDDLPYSSERDSLFDGFGVGFFLEDNIKDAPKIDKLLDGLQELTNELEGTEDLPISNNEVKSKETVGNSISSSGDLSIKSKEDKVQNKFQISKSEDQSNINIGKKTKLLEKDTWKNLALGESYIINPSIMSLNNATIDEYKGNEDEQLMSVVLAKALSKHILFSGGCSILSELGNKEISNLEEKKVSNSLHPQKDIITKTYITDSNLDPSNKSELKDIDKVLEEPRLHEILQETFSNLTINKNKKKDDEDEDDLTYTKTHLMDFLNNQFASKNTLNINALMNKYKKTLNYHKTIALKSMEDLKDQPGKKNTLTNKLDIKRILQERVAKTQMKKEVIKESEEEDFDRDISLDIRNIGLESNEDLKILDKSSNEKILKDKEGLETCLSELQKEDEAIKAMFKVFDNNYNLDKSILEEANSKKDQPSESDIRLFCQTILVKGTMELEIPIISLLYIEKLMKKSGLLMNHLNWRRFVFIGLILAYKARHNDFTDNIMINYHFPTIPIKHIEILEKTFLKLINFEIYFTAAEYAKYYFILRSISENENKKFPLQPLTINQANMFQENVAFVEGKLIYKYSS